MPEIVGQLKVLCSLDWNSTSVDAEVELEHHDGCNIHLRIKPDTSVPITSTDDCYITPLDGQEWQFSRSKIFISRIDNKSTNGNLEQTISAQMPFVECKKSHSLTQSDNVAFCFSLTNFPTFIRINHPSITLSGHNIVLQPVSFGQVNRIVFFEDIRYDQYGILKKLLDDFCWLTSFACGGLVSCSRIDIFHDDTPVEIHLYSPDTSLEPKSSVIHNRFDPDSIKNFMEGCYSQFQQNGDNYSIKGLIHLGILAKHSPYVETKVLLMSNFLEVLRYNYALNVGVPNGTFRQARDYFRWVAGSNAGNNASFKEIIEHFCSSIALSGWSDDYKDLRNKIVHTGQIVGNDKYARYTELHHFCDRIVMALLEYDSITP
ncbi:hypothetical protein KAT92_06045, partial [Candidatus Babeliales bacterium]|nr:hypothetical protein [Candidatus Babeliales bacterium]